MRKLPYLISLVFLCALLACEEEKEHIAPAINPRDSVPMMMSYGVNTLISDSGVIKYRIVAEQCDFRVSIPMKGKLGSLNASASAAVVMYEILRRRMTNASSNC